MVLGIVIQSFTPGNLESHSTIMVSIRMHAIIYAKTTWGATNLVRWARFLPVGCCLPTTVLRTFVCKAYFERPKKDAQTHSRWAVLFPVLPGFIDIF